MVTPKQSQKILTWCIESALNLLYRAIELKSEKLKYSDISNYFRNELKNKDVSSDQISKMTYELKRQNYLGQSDGDSVKLTNKAKIKLIDKYLDKNDSDNKRRLISFDIPEVKRTQRNKFRRAIKRIGFVQIQKSLWVCDKNLGDLVETIIKEYKVENYVAYFVVDNSNIEKHIKTILSKRNRVRKK